MKKFIAFLLALWIVLGLCACGGNGGEHAALQAGFGRANISPTKPLGMSGYGDAETRLSGAILDDIYATCVAFREGETTFLVFTVDVCGVSNVAGNQLRSTVSSATGVPQEHIFVGATHTHSAPSWNGSTSSGCVTAAKAAIADLAPATMETASAQLENMNFVRHYLMNDGTYYGSNFGSDISGFKEHVMDPDKQLSLLKLERGDKKDILMVNWQAHPAAAARQADYTGVSADFVGFARKKVEMDAGVLMAYYTGASGNLNPRSLIGKENTNNNTNYQNYGATLGEKIIETMEKLTPAEGSGMVSTYSKVPVEVDHSWDHMASQASEVVSVWKNQSLEAGHKLARQYGMSSAYHANAILRKGALKEQQYRELYAFRIGAVGFVTNTYEMFCDHGQYVKEGSPFETTFIITGCSGYIANEQAYSYRSYESDTSPYVSGTGEKLAEELTRMLNTLK